MSDARETLAARLVDDEGGCRVDRIAPDIRAAIDEIDALRAELSALKARRCDGCAHWKPGSPHGPEHGECRVDAVRPIPPMFTHGYLPSDHTAEVWVAMFTSTGHSCGAWTPKEQPAEPSVAVLLNRQPDPPSDYEVVGRVEVERPCQTCGGSERLSCPGPSQFNLTQKGLTAAGLVYHKDYCNGMHMGGHPCPDCTKEPQP